VIGTTPSPLLLRSMIMSKRITIPFTICLLLAAATSTAEMRAVEQAIESSTASLSLPDRLPGSISIAACDNGCAPTLLQLTATSQFFFGRQTLSFVELRDLSLKPALNVAVYFEPQSKTITRIVVSAR